MYEQQDPQEQIYPTQQPAMPGQMTEGLLQYQIDSNEIIEEIEHILKGELMHYNSKTGSMEWEKKKHIKALINERGINGIISILKSRLTKIFILSDFDEDKIVNMTINIGQNVIDELYFNWEEYEIPSTSAASIVLNMVTDTVYATLRKGYLGNYMKFLKTSQRISEVQTFTPNRQDQQQGSNNKMFGFFRRK